MVLPSFGEHYLSQPESADKKDMCYVVRVKILRLSISPDATEAAKMTRICRQPHSNPILPSF